MTRSPSRVRATAAAATLVVALGATVAAGLLLPAHAARSAAAPRATSAVAPPAEPHPTATPSSAASTSPVPAATERALATKRITTRSAETAVATFVQAVDSVTPESLTSAITPVVAGQAKAELQAQQLEFQHNGWTVRGATRVASVRLLSSRLTGATPTARVEACIDSSDVTLLGSDGKPVVTDPQSVRRALNLYGLAYTQGAWHIVEHSFPADPAC